MTRHHLAAFSVVLVLGAIGTGAVLAAFDVAGEQETTTLTGPGPYRGSEPPPGLRMPAFSLRDVVSGERIDSDQLREEVVLVTFLDTECREQCPIIAGEIGRALRLLPADVRAQTSALVISVNPKIDARPSVVRFLRERRADELTYLSGTVSELQPVWRRFGIVSAYETGDADTHSADVRIFDPETVWVSTQHAGVDLTPANLGHDIRLALASAPSP
jgi:cytochrome oxidase Cu insertion factor (SCO1/SenC/PrrC family)